MAGAVQAERAASQTSKGRRTNLTVSKVSAGQWDGGPFQRNCCSLIWLSKLPAASTSHWSMGRGGAGRGGAGGGGRQLHRKCWGRWRRDRRWTQVVQPSESSMSSLLLLLFSPPPHPFLLPSPPSSLSLSLCPPLSLPSHPPSLLSSLKSCFF